MKESQVKASNSASCRNCSKVCANSLPVTQRLGFSGRFDFSPDLVPGHRQKAVVEHLILPEDPSIWGAWWTLLTIVIRFRLIFAPKRFSAEWGRMRRCNHHKWRRECWIKKRKLNIRCYCHRSVSSTIPTEKLSLVTKTPNEPPSCLEHGFAKLHVVGSCRITIVVNIFDLFLAGGGRINRCCMISCPNKTSFPFIANAWFLASTF